MAIEYKKGNLFHNLPLPEERVRIIIPHVTNDIGAWGSGFVVPLGEYFPDAREHYLRGNYYLGTCHLIQCDEDVYVANMCAQTGIMSKSTGPIDKVNTKPIRYEALVNCLRQIENYCKAESGFEPIEIHAPKFGSDRAGGNWNFIEELIEEILVSPSKIVVYTL